METKPTVHQLKQFASQMENKSAQEVLRWAMDIYGSRIALASSFGPEDIVLIDIMTKIDKEKTRIFTLDTGRLNQETYDLIDTISRRYNIRIEVFFPEHKEIEQMVEEKGMNLMYESVENRKLCCEIRKVHSLKRALKKLDGWITGLRREQFITRAHVKKVEIDSTHSNIVKVNPLADWTHEMVWAYIHENNIPYNRLHDIGYVSIGCEPCTRAIEPNEDPRSGRWWWETGTPKECGLHLGPIKQSEK
ncbi:MAG: phosphoadenylyl-sulfate reductase [Candidatus Nitrosopolaris sp.]